MEKSVFINGIYLSTRVENARDAQENAKQQFGSALDQFQSANSVKSTSLKKEYKKLQAEFDNSEATANG